MARSQRLKIGVKVLGALLRTAGEAPAPHELNRCQI
jgi:hypothetical protein